MAETDLLPCPFCGDTMEGFAGCVPGAFASGGGKFSVECDCGALGGFASSMAEAVAVWNRRAALSGTREAGEPVADAVLEAARTVIDTASRTFTARNGRQCSIEGDDGEQCMIVGFDPFNDLVNALDALAAAPPAEVERGAVTDEALRVQYWNAFYGHIDAHQGNTSEASARSHASGVVDRAIFEAGEPTPPAPAPQPAVEAQGAMALARFTPTPSGRMMWDKYGEWVDRSDCMRALASEKARADRAEQERDEARRHISNLLARIHRDGGHHEARIGTAQAVEDADSVVSHLFVAQDELKAAEAAHDATCNVLADAERRRMNAEAEMAKLREAASELIAAEDAWDREREHDERCRRALNDLRAALRPTTSEEGTGE